MDRQLPSSIRTDTAKRHFYQVWSIIGIVLIIAAAGYVSGVLSTPIAIVVWAAIFVLILRKPVAFFEAHGIPRVLGTALSYLLFALVLGLLGIVMFSPAFGLGDQLSSLIASVPSYVQEATRMWNDFSARYADIMQNTRVSEWVDSMSSSLISWANDFAASSATGIVEFGAGLANSLMIIGFALVVAFWLLMELPALSREMSRLVPESRREGFDMLRRTTTRIIDGYLLATLAVCTIVGIACGILYIVAGVPNAGILAIIVGVFNVIPVIGHWIGLILVVVIAAFTNPVLALVVFIGTIVIQEAVYTFVQPKLMANSVDVHPVLVILALFIGSAAGSAVQGLFGSVVGMLISIPVAALAKALFVYYYERGTGLQVVAEDGVFFKGSPSSQEVPGTKPDAVADAIAPAPKPKKPTGAAAWLTTSISPALTGKLGGDGKGSARKAGRSSASYRHERCDANAGADASAQGRAEANPDRTDVGLDVSVSRRQK